MDPDVVRVASLLAVIGAFGTFVAVVGLGIRAISVRLRVDRARPEPLSQISDARFARLEQAVDAIAIEVERISEAQRFAAQLMSERAPDRASAPMTRDRLPPGPSGQNT